MRASTCNIRSTSFARSCGDSASRYLSSSRFTALLRLRAIIAPVVVLIFLATMINGSAQVQNGNLIGRHISDPLGPPPKPTPAPKEPPAKAEDFRIVEGQLYNIQRSVRWTDIGFQFVAHTNGLTFAKKMATEFTPGEMVAIRNCTVTNLIADGKFSSRVMLVGRTNIFELWDHGLPNVAQPNPPAVISKMKLK